MIINDGGEYADAKNRDSAGERRASEKLDDVGSPESSVSEEKLSEFFKAAYYWVLSRH